MFAKAFKKLERLEMYHLCTIVLLMNTTVEDRWHLDVLCSIVHLVTELVCLYLQEKG